MDMNNLKDVGYHWLWLWGKIICPIVYYLKFIFVIIKIKIIIYVRKNCCEAPQKRLRVPFEDYTQNKPQRTILKGSADQHLICTLTTDFITQEELCL